MIVHSNQSTGQSVVNSGAFTGFDPNTIFSQDVTLGGGAGAEGRGGDGTTVGMKSSSDIEESNLTGSGSGSGTGSMNTSSAGGQLSFSTSSNAVDQSSTYSLNLGSGMVSKGGIFNGLNQVQGPTSVLGQNQNLNQSQSKSQNQILGETDGGVALLSPTVESEIRETTVLSLKRKVDEICHSIN